MRTSAVAWGQIGERLFFDQMRKARIRRQEWLREAAYYLWEKAGRPEGRDEEFWQLAEEEYDAYTIRF
jgi:hypothetical protein